MTREKTGWLLRCAALLVAGVYFGCAATPEKPDFDGGGRLILLAPLNFDTRLPANLKAGRDAVKLELVRYLRARGFEVKAIRRDRFEVLYQGGLQRDERVRDGDFGERVGLLLAKLSRERSGALIAVPDFVARRVDFKGHHIEWDGVQRKPVIDAFKGKVRYAAATADVVSLEVGLWDSTGKQVHVGIGGFAVPTMTQWGRTKRVNASGRLQRLEIQEGVPRPDLFDDPAEIRESLRLALSPFVPLP